MLKRLNPSLSFLLLAVSLWLLQFSFDKVVGDGDGKITMWGAYIFIGFLQVFFTLASLIWLPEVFRRLKGDITNDTQEFLKKNSASVMLTVILFCVILIDFFAFAYFNEPAVERKFKASHYRTPHPCFHHGLVQNMAVEGNWGDIKYPLYTNSFAFKDSTAFDASQDLSKKQLVVIGDSFTEGVGVAYQYTFFGRLRRAFRNNENLEIWNMGCISYSPLLYYNKVKYYTEIENFKIDYLWVFIDGSDIQDEINYKEHVPDCNHKYVPQAGTIEYYRYNIKKDKNLLNIYTNHSLIVKLTKSVYHKMMHSDKQTKEEKYIQNRLSWIDNEEVYQDWGKEGVSLAKNHMQKLVELCRQKNIKLGIVVYPWPGMIDNHKRYVDTWKGFSEKNNIPFINLIGAFRSKVEETSFEEVRKEYFIEGDGHWNAEGHRLVAENVFRPMHEMTKNQSFADSLLAE